MFRFARRLRHCRRSVLARDSRRQTWRRHVFGSRALPQLRCRRRRRHCNGEECFQKSGVHRCGCSVEMSLNNGASVDPMSNMIYRRCCSQSRGTTQEWEYSKWVSCRLLVVAKSRIKSWNAASGQTHVWCRVFCPLGRISSSASGGRKMGDVCLEARLVGKTWS